MSERRAHLVHVVNELLKFDTTAEQIIMALEFHGISFESAEPRDSESER